MDQAKLADEIRGAGNAVRFADGPVIGGSWKNGKFVAMHSPRTKLKTPDSEVIRMASTCSTCDAVASKSDRESAQEWSDCYQSFARLIWPCINHEPGCIAEPYISVSEEASARFAKIKAKFEAERKARESGIVASRSTKSRTVSQDKKKTKKSKRRLSEADMIVLGIMQAVHSAIEGKATRKKGSVKKKPAKRPGVTKTRAKKKPVKNSKRTKPGKRPKR